MASLISCAVGSASLPYATNMPRKHCKRCTSLVKRRTGGSISPGLQLMYDAEEPASVGTRLITGEDGSVTHFRYQVCCSTFTGD